MPTFRNLDTGNVVSVKERWAGKLRTQPHLVELTPEGDEMPQEPQPVTATDPALKRLRKADLQDMLRQRGEEVDDSWSKDQLVTRIAATEPDRAGGSGTSLPSPGAPEEDA